MANFKLLSKNHPLGEEGELVTETQVLAWSPHADFKFLMDTGVLKPLGDALVELRTDKPTVPLLLTENSELAETLQDRTEELHRAKIRIGALEDEANRYGGERKEFELQKREFLETHASTLGERDEHNAQAERLQAEMDALRLKLTEAEARASGSHPTAPAVGEIPSPAQVPVPAPTIDPMNTNARPPAPGTVPGVAPFPAPNPGPAPVKSKQKPS